MRNALTKRFLSLVMALAMIVGLTAVVPSMETIVNAKEITVFSQTDSRWADHPYGYSDTSCTTRAYISGGGCGILSYVNAVYYLNGSFIEPTFLADWSVNNGHRANGVGTKLSLYKAFADSQGTNYGFAYNGYSSSYATLRERLSAGEVAVGSAPGHLMALVDYDPSSGRFLILDSYKSSNRYTYEKGYTWQTESSCRNTYKLNFSAFYFLKNTKHSPHLALTDGEIQRRGNFTAQIVHAASGKMVSNDSGDAKLYASKTSNTAAVTWDFIQNSDGTYTIMDNVDHKVLDAYGAGTSDSTNVFLWKNENSKNQKWYLHKRSDGKYYLRPSYSDDLVLDIEGGSSSSKNGTNVQLYHYFASDGQLFWINETNRVADLGKDFYALILNTDCWQPIVQANSGNVCLGRERSPCPDGTTVVKNANYDRTLWHFVRNNDDGSYIIKSVYNNYCLKVSPDSNGNFEVNGNNVKCYNGDGSTKAQRWFIIRRPDSKGGFTLRPLITSKVLDLTGNKSDESTNIEVWESHDGEAQRFSIYQLDKTRDKLSYKISADKKTVQQNQKTNISISGTLPYVYKFKIHIIDPDNKETVKDNGPSPVYSFSGSKVGKYIIFAEAISPLYNNSGSATKKCVTINVTCAHSITSTPAKAATCTANGNTAYWYCSNCKKYFSDKNCTKEITKASTVIAKTGHKATAYAAKPAACTTDGNIAYWYCSNCK